ncbi:MAG: acetylglutamate kinase [Myxococcales bacterium]|nr:acetylglutamate kinase [Myxococcales bacterium]
MADLRDRKVLIKVGGETVRALADRQRLARDVAAVVATGAQVIVIHGAGPQITELGQRLGIASVFRAGRRVTDAAMLQAVAMAMCGEVGPNLLAAFLGVGLPAVATTAASAGLAIGVKRAPTRVTGESEPVDFGLVADVATVNGALVACLWQAGFVPVLSSLVADADGQLLNVNADTLVTALVPALGIDDVVLVTGVPGVFGDIDDPATHMAHLTPAQIGPLIQSGAVKGGMVAKLEEVAKLLQRGVRRVILTGFGHENAIADALLGRPGLRTIVEGELP